MRQNEIEEDRAVFGVIDDEDDLIVEEARVDDVADRAHAGDGVIEFEMPVIVPGERRDAIALRDAEPRQRVGELFRPAHARRGWYSGEAAPRPMRLTISVAP